MVAKKNPRQTQLESDQACIDTIAGLTARNVFNLTNLFLCALSHVSSADRPVLEAEYEALNAGTISLGGKFGTMKRIRAEGITAAEREWFGGVAGLFGRLSGSIAQHSSSQTTCSSSSVEANRMSIVAERLCWLSQPLQVAALKMN